MIRVTYHLTAVQRDRLESMSLSTGLGMAELMRRAVDLLLDGQGRQEDSGEGRIVRRRADEVRRTTPERLDEIEAIRDEDIDCSDIPERIGERRRIERKEGGGSATSV